MTRWKITIEYNGQNYAGWQHQDDLPTIQGEIEKALKGFCQQDIRVHGAGRTDAGVHAKGQIAHFDLDYGERPLTGFDLTKALNAHLRPQPISILNATKVDDGFHARFSAKEKLYSYLIVNRTSFLALDQGKAWLIKKPLDTVAMQEAAYHLLGKHDFTTFRASECQAKSPERTLDELRVEAREYDGEDGLAVLIHARAQSFLHHQVRNIVGTLVLVGEGKWQPEEVKIALEAKDRSAGGPTAPADGLYLIRIDYPEK